MPQDIEYQDSLYQKLPVFWSFVTLNLSYFHHNDIRSGQMEYSLKYLISAVIWTPILRGYNWKCLLLNSFNAAGLLCTSVYGLYHMSYLKFEIFLLNLNKDWVLSKTKEYIRNKKTDIFISKS